ncbi:F420-dependent protein [Gordonia pseudamarae]|jgi:PPOX class probable F420-dependent enzyme|uniref:F420-dependent protein n=1 Tax=Gordonia pseudamarae TaxID=2831662 RepID=A0ABX6IKY4_9ACTN|nr:MULTISPECIES: pyridoxamine 5'-phosphate oxidase family protein [Gordonia]MBD0023161.1 pyridoxamine 5'-phosphate oxidase family protein [Gordonia sp. (in: high G+C Gram-positive bacteria)]QHN27124.1 F420-dependent protein [Gordonia pseudamarae]QHN36014.1 F420-dependent protein [Gordonia pseudamarae]
MIHTLPDEYRDLLERPLIGILATVSPDGRPSQQPMRFTWDGAHLRMSQTIPRRKFVPLQANPNYSFIITDPDIPERVLEITGWLVTVGGDPDGDFYRQLGRHYGNPDEPVPADVDDRVVLILDAQHFIPRTAPQAPSAAHAG